MWCTPISLKHIVCRFVEVVVVLFCNRGNLINQFVEVLHLSLRFGMVRRNRFMDESCFISELLKFVGIKRWSINCPFVLLLGHHALRIFSSISLEPV